MTLRVKAAFVTLASTNFDGLVEFYSRLFGQAPQPLIAGVYAEFDCCGMRLGIFKPKPDHAIEFAHPLGSGVSVCLEVVNLEEAIAHLTLLGYPPRGPITKASHGREIYAYDPNGNRLILHQAD